MNELKRYYAPHVLPERRYHDETEVVLAAEHEDETAKLKEEIKRLESWVTAAGEFILGQTYLMNDDEKLIVKKFANKIIDAARGVHGSHVPSQPMENTKYG